MHDQSKSRSAPGNNTRGRLSRSRFRGAAGQVLVGVIALLLILSILVPVMVMFVQNEARWTAKEQKNTTAFHLAEAATERGYWKISQSSQPTQAIPITGYKFDQSYSDISGGTYAINIGSDSSRNIIITGIGRDSLRREVRAVQVQYAPSTNSNNAVYNFGAANAQVSGNAYIEWGPVYSQANITGNTRTYPRLYSLQTITGNPLSYCAGPCPASPCTDSVHYWCCSCAANQSVPQPDLNYYRTQAQNANLPTNAAPSGCNTSTSGGSDPKYYQNGHGYFRNCQDTSGNVYFVEDGDITFQDSGPLKNFIVGTVVLALGSSINMTGDVGSGSYDASVPPNAWKEYGINWGHYQSFDAGAPPSFPGLTGAYTANATYHLSHVVVHGYLYDGGDMNLNGGAGNVIHGAVTINGTTMDGGFTLYYDTGTAANVRLSGTPTYTRTSWKDLPGQGWPAGLP